MKKSWCQDTGCGLCFVFTFTGDNKDTHTHPFNSPLSRTTRVSQYQKGKTNLDFTEARDSEWQWHHLGCMQVCTSLQTDNHASTRTTPLSFLQAGCPSCHPTNSVRALKVNSWLIEMHNIWFSVERDCQLWCYGVLLCANARLCQLTVDV